MSTLTVVVDEPRSSSPTMHIDAPKRIWIADVCGLRLGERAADFRITGLLADWMAAHVGRCWPPGRITATPCHHVSCARLEVCGRCRIILLLTDLNQAYAVRTGDCAVVALSPAVEAVEHPETV